MPSPSRKRRAQTLTVLETADQHLAGWTCPASTECCRFAETGREPYLTHAEWQLIEAEIARQGRKLPAIPEDRTCPLLTAEGRCSVYAVRPLGCRTFYCRRASGPSRYPRATLAALVHELEAISASSEDPGRPGGLARTGKTGHDSAHGRPITAWLRSARESRPRRKR